MFEICFTKWGGGDHWRFVAETLGRDRFGLWLATPSGSWVRRGGRFSFVTVHDAVTLVPDEGEWIAHWNAEGEFEIYVDVTTRPSRDAGVVTAVDLDLDVVRLRDGRVEVLDEDEFAEHQVSLAYPPELISQARATADRLARAISARVEPFNRVGAEWLGHGLEHCCQPQSSQR